MFYCEFGVVIIVFLEKKKVKKKVLLTILAVLFIAYIASYLLIRQSYKQTHEMDGCPADGCIEIEFPADGFYNIYRPLIGIDIILTKTEFCNHGKKCSYSFR